MNNPAQIQHRYSILKIPNGETCPAINEEVDLNHFTTVGDGFDELGLARDQMADIKDLDKDDNTFIVCDTTTWKRVV